MYEEEEQFDNSGIKRTVKVKVPRTEPDREPAEIFKSRVLEFCKLKIRLDMDVYQKVQLLKYSVSPQALAEIQNVEYSKVYDALNLKLKKFCEMMENDDSIK